MRSNSLAELTVALGSEMAVGSSDGLGSSSCRTLEHCLAETVKDFTKPFAEDGLVDASLMGPGAN